MSQKQNLNEEFYVGYQPRPTPLLGSWMRKVVFGLLILTVDVALLLVFLQAPFAEAYFEYGTVRPFTGTIRNAPYPMLFAGDSQYLLVGPGKHGVADLFAGKSGSCVSMRGTRIGKSALEVEPDSVRVEQGGGTGDLTRETSLGPVTLTGEIVDTKCHFGVMNPGSGKVHRDCAARCLSGGVPPGLLVRDAAGRLETFLLAGVVARDVLQLVAEPVQVSGELARVGSFVVLRVNGPEAIRRVGE